MLRFPPSDSRPASPQPETSAPAFSSANTGRVSPSNYGAQSHAFNYEQFIDFVDNQPSFMPTGYERERSKSPMTRMLEEAIAQESSSVNQMSDIAYLNPQQDATYYGQYNPALYNPGSAEILPAWDNFYRDNFYTGEPSSHAFPPAASQSINPSDFKNAEDYWAALGRPDLMQAYGLLELYYIPDATLERVTAQYRELSREYHPDKVTESAAKAAAEKEMQALNSAYETVKSHLQGKT